LVILFVAGTAVEMTWWTVELSIIFGTIAVITLFFGCLALVLGQLHYWSEYKLARLSPSGHSGWRDLLDASPRA
jgi:hypothetical protein